MKMFDIFIDLDSIVSISRSSSLYGSILCKIYLEGSISRYLNIYIYIYRWFLYLIFLIYLLNISISGQMDLIFGISRKE